MRILVQLLLLVILGVVNAKCSIHESSESSDKQRPTRKVTRRTTPATTVGIQEPNPTAPGLTLTPTDFCESCAMRGNQKDYYVNDQDCHTYYQCFFFNETFTVGILRQCPPNTFWSDQVLQCLPEGATPCFDLCQTDSVATAGCHAPADNCAAFFICSNGYSAPFCCPATTSFDVSSCSCVADSNCTDVCTLPPAVVTVVAPATNNGTFCVDSFGVTLSEVAGRPDQYTIYDMANNTNPISTVMNCAPGTLFDLVTCRCDIFTEGLEAMPPSRQCILWLPFETDLQDHSVQLFRTNFYGTGGLDTTASADGTGSLFIDGGRLEIPGLKTFDFQKAASFCLFFRCENGGTTNPYSCLTSGGILSNNNNVSMTGYSLIMATQPTDQLTGRVRMRNPGGTAIVNSAINTPTSGWNQACLTFDGANVILYVNGVAISTTPGLGSVAIGHCPYVLGTDQTFGDFVGHVDDVLVCPFVLSPEEITAHSQGNFASLAAAGLIPSP